jgi:hypothetical protein
MVGAGIMEPHAAGTGITTADGEKVPALSVDIKAEAQAVVPSPEPHEP